MALALLKRILRGAEERGQQVDPRRLRRPHRASRGARAALPHLGGGRRARVLDARARRPDRPDRDPDHAAPRRDPRPARPRHRLREPARSPSSPSARTASASQTKTRAGRRTVDVGPRRVRLLREQQLARTPNADGCLFPTRVGRAFDAHNFMRRVFKPAARARRHPRAHLPRPPPHRRLADDRRRLPRQGDRRADGPRRRRRLVLSRYGHLYKGARRQAAIALESHVFGAAYRILLWDGRGMNARLGLDLDAR